MTMWDLLVVTCFLVPIFTAMEMASRAGARIPGYTSSLMIGLLVGVSFAFSMWSLHTKLVKLPQATSSAVLGAILIAAVIVDFVWIGVAMFVGGWATSAMFRLVH